MNHTCRAVYGADGRWLGRRVSNRDITERKEFEERIQRLSRLYATLSQVNQTIVRVEDRDTLFQSICRVAIEYGKFRVAWIGLIEPQTGCVRPAAYSTFGGDCLNRIDVSGNALFDREPLVSTLEEGQIITYDDVREAPGLQAWREAALRCGCQAAAVVPIRFKGEVVGVLNLYAAVPGHFADDEERSLLEEIGVDISFALDMIEAQAEHKRAGEAQARLEQQLRQAQKMESIGRLAGGIAHDFNNLLGVIIGYSEIALMTMPGDDSLREKLQEIMKAGERAADLTRQLLAFSRKQVIEPTVFDLNSATADLSRMLERTIGEDIQLVMFLCDGVARVKADRGQIEQVLMNLVVNARDAMPSGGKLTIETANVSLDETYARDHFPVVPGRYVMFAVSDTGVGVDAEIQRYIFEPFFTTKEKGKGTGLGLSTTYGIIKQSGGYIWVYSEPNKGSTFKVYLPWVAANEDAMPKTEMALSLEGNETILLVEDAEGLRKLAQECLENKGYRVLAAKDAQEALTISKQNRGPIHLLLTDVVLPGIGGRELARQLVPMHPETRVLYMSGYTDNAIVHHGVLEPGIAFLQKPFTVNNLWQKVRDVLDSIAGHKGDGA